MKKSENQNGFTIIELLIATVIFSMVLLVITGVIVQINKIYYRGIIQSRTQERARAILDDMSQAIQYSSGTIAPGSNAGSYCLGSRRYIASYGVNQSGTQPVLLADTPATCPPLTPAAADRREMVGENMQLVNLNVENITGNTYRVTVRLVYGQDSDFEGGNPANSCKSIAIGGQFCAVSELSTTVTQRYN